VIPHHDFTVGQFKPFLGEEGIRSSAQLDFVERSIVGQINDARDLGLTIHGTWWNDRFQYWLGVFDAAGNYYGSAGQAQNRSDDNDDKDYSARVLVRPLWKNECWGSIELGYSIQGGRHGESNASNPLNDPHNDLNRTSSWALRHGAWFSYMPGGPVRGLWIRAEGSWIKDRNAPDSVLDETAADENGNGFQDRGKPFVSKGGYVAIGYKISDSRWNDCSPGWLKPFEFALRAETFENIQIADLVSPDLHTDNFKTHVYTAGINYYIKGHDAKIQLNYNKVDEASDGNANRSFREVRNDNFVVNFQVAF
jgi:hypothetical protein